jgi:hypothetical protein
MIKANELRFGNIVFELESVIVHSINEHGINRDKQGVVIPFDMLTGIPLNAELLEKCGFETNMDDPENKWLRLKTRNHVFEADESTQFEIVYVDVHGYKVGFAKHLHQLQNLFFALTGQELEVNLNTAKYS